MITPLVFQQTPTFDINSQTLCDRSLARSESSLALKNTVAQILENQGPFQARMDYHPNFK